MKNEYEVRGDHVAIFLHRRNGQTLEALVDLEDFPRVNEYPGMWGPKSGRGGRYYAQGVLYTPRDSNGVQHRVKGQSLLLSRFILGNPRNLFVDHIKADATLDNRRKNLRPATRVLNGLNRVNPRNIVPHVDGWRADIVFKGTLYKLGTFTTVSEARAAYAGALALATELAISDSCGQPVTPAEVSHGE